MSEALGVRKQEEVAQILQGMNAKEEGGLEIELPFLIKEITPHVQALITKAIETDAYEIISQGYLTVDGRNVRLRESWNPLSGMKHVLTDKKTVKPGIMLEHEVPIKDENELAVIWNLTKGKKVRKVRFKIPYEADGLAYAIELDVFLRKNQGLVRAEVEFKGVNKKEGKRAMKNFREHMPEWFGEDLSKNRRMKNSQLAAEGLPAKDLAKNYGWKPLPLPDGITAILEKRKASGAKVLDTKI